MSLYINVVTPKSKGDEVPCDTESVTFTIYKGKSPSLTTFSEFNVPAVQNKANPMSWYADYTIPFDAPYGPYTITWQVNLTSGDSHFVEDLFYVEDTKALTSDGPSATIVLDGVQINARIMQLLKHIRIALRDNNPDRNYRAMPPKSSRELQGYSNRIGFVWTDEEIYSYLQLAVQDLNSWNPKTSRVFTLYDFPAPWLGVVVDMASVRALQALTTNWVQDEFGYSISGLSLDLNKSDKFNALRTSIESGLELRKTNATAIRPMGRAITPARWNI